MGRQAAEEAQGGGMKNYKYKWSRPYKVDAQVAGEIFQSCTDDAQVIQLARAKNHPLHGDFDWNDTSAAEAFRLHQCRQMRCSLQIEVVNSEKKVSHLRAFVRTIDRVGFVPTLEANPDELNAAEQKCWEQMTAFKARWKSLQFAREVIDAIQQKERTIVRKKRKAN